MRLILLLVFVIQSKTLPFVMLDVSRWIVRSSYFARKDERREEVRHSMSDDDVMSRLLPNLEADCRR